MSASWVRGARWDLICRVVDNFGDAGVALRLARQLSQEHGVQVRLWIDQPDVLRRLLGPDEAEDLVGNVAAGCQPEARPTHGIGALQVGDWSKFHELGSAQVPWPVVLIEMFGCGLPESLAARLQAVPPPQSSMVWINLEYLSAEAWVEGCHRLRSQVGEWPVYWFFPGFTPQTGGLLRELALDDWQESGDGEVVVSRANSSHSRAVIIFLFVYDQAHWSTALTALSQANVSCEFWVPAGVLPSWSPGTSDSQGAWTLKRVPFVPQQAFDAVLRQSDFVVVRGEDSFVRAQWAARPMLWHIYPQGDGAHWVKLEAFWQRFWGQVADETRVALQLSQELVAQHIAVHTRLSRAVNGDPAAGALLVEDWEHWLSHWAFYRQASLVWRAYLRQQSDLTTQLIWFAKDCATAA